MKYIVMDTSKYCIVGFSFYKEYECKDLPWQHFKVIWKAYKKGTVFYVDLYFSVSKYRIYPIISALFLHPIIPKIILA